MSIGSTWGSSQQVCATCRYWSGSREIDCFASCFTIKDDTGVCNGPDGSFRGMQMGDAASCSEWAPFR